ncbi:helix-turn-helix domain-containing protein [Desulforamulus aquiferis]|uniref:Helix-turn-helix domain-containing protein n=1 Tax=Desulforamulus aquiferis TaxID=1397668 RepID=A0AAW7Z9Q2_9FIRM|nr:helix-turn-helix domain-containing protein [Desulforamulus aquiferis]MDO7786379.1 helix-turn-helix domain-containing protein [Desulforamulus aquiferis]
MQLYTVSEVAKKLKRRKSKVYELIYSGELEATKHSERGLRVSDQALQKYLESKKVIIQGNNEAV